MPAIANYPDRCELLNLGYGPQGKGPYVVRQHGHEPGSMDLTQNVYFLRKDGVWVWNLAVISLPETEQESVLYGTLAEAMSMLTELSGGTPVVDAALPAGRTVEELQSAAADTANRLVSRLHAAKRETITP